MYTACMNKPDLSDKRFKIVQSTPCLVLSEYQTPEYRYFLAHVFESPNSAHWRLYGMSKTNLDAEFPSELNQILGVFDTEGQASYYVDLHSENPLFIPALTLRSCDLDISKGIYVSNLPPYAGVYRVGFKSYVVAISERDPALRSLTYVDRYRTQYLGEANELESCLILYSHFDQRLRGCKMC